jgi:hypothetical protein
MNVPQHSLEVQYALKPREITGDLYQRSRPAIVSDNKKRASRRLRDRCTYSMGVSWLTPTILGDVCGTCRHDGMAVLGSKMSTSGTRGLGLPVGCASDQARRWSTTDVCIRQAECRRRLDTGYPRASCRQINTGKCLDPPLTYQHYSRFSGYHTPHKSGCFVLFGSLTHKQSQYA